MTKTLVERHMKARPLSWYVLHRCRVVITAEDVIILGERPEEMVYIIMLAAKYSSWRVLLLLL